MIEQLAPCTDMNADPVINIQKIMRRWLDHAGAGLTLDGAGTLCQQGPLGWPCIKFNCKQDAAPALMRLQACGKFR